MTARLAAQTIIWGTRLGGDINSWRAPMARTAAAGFSGIEIAQPPSRLPPITELLELLAEHELELIGLAGGSIAQRVAYSQGHSACYLYSDTFDDAVMAACKGRMLALHPHVGKPVRTLSQVWEIIDDDTEDTVLLIPDTGHLHLLDEDSTEAIRDGLGRKRIASIHLKDWAPEYGRSIHRYARGFVELGRGTVHLEAVLDCLHEVRFDGWLVIEQDNTHLDPIRSLTESLSWLADRGVQVNAGAVAAGEVSAGSDERAQPGPEPELRASLHRIIDVMMRSSLVNVAQCHAELVECLRDLTACTLVTMWAHSSISEVLTLVALSPAMDGLMQSLPAGEALTARAIATQSVQTYDLRDAATRVAFHDRSLLSRLDPHTLVSLPVRNLWNPHHTQYIVNFLLCNDDPQPDRSALYALAEHVSFAADVSIEDACSEHGSRANLIARDTGTLSSLLKGVASLVQEGVQCQGVTVFMEDAYGERLLAPGTTGLTWHCAPDEQFYRKGDGLVGSVWEDRKARATVGGAGLDGDRRGRSEEEVPSTATDNCLFVPFFGSDDHCIGVVRCRNKVGAGTAFQDSAAFSDTDLAIVEAVMQSIVPRMEILADQHHRTEALARLTHELREPLVAIRGTAQLMEAAAETLCGADANVVAANARRIMSWSHLMRRLLNTVDLYQYTPERLELIYRPTLIRADVIMPAIAQVQTYVVDRGFSPHNIRVGSFDDIPRIHIDRDRFEQVMFNLLSNTIKYYSGDRRSFRVNIGSARVGRWFQITVTDWGIGIDEDMRDAVFGDRVRGRQAVHHHVSGQGLGLWIVRLIVEAHGGQVWVSKVGQPTQFTIQLPVGLADGPLTDDDGDQYDIAD